MMTEATKAKNLTLRPVLGRILLLYLCGFLHMLACAPTVSRDVICVDFLCLGQIGFAFLVPAYPGCPGKEGVKWF